MEKWLDFIKDADYTFNQAKSKWIKETRIPFLEAFNATDFKDKKEEILELAKTGELSATTLENKYSSAIQEAILNVSAHAYTEQEEKQWWVLFFG